MYIFGRKRSSLTLTNIGAGLKVRILDSGFVRIDASKWRSSRASQYLNKARLSFLLTSQPDPEPSQIFIG
jgi:hypothetical protein